MKKWISILACTLAAVSALVSCEPKETPDGKCELTAFTLTASLNSGLAADIVGVIDATGKTITLVIPTSVTTNRFVPTFTATQFDVVKIGGTEVKSGETSVTLTDGTKISLSDEVSVLNTDYTVKLLSNDELAELVSITFKAAENSLLDVDVAPEAIAPQMVVRVPGQAFRQELTLTLTAGSGDAITVNNTSVESGASIKVDTSFPIDITVSDAVAGKKVDYVLKVGKILDYVVTKLGSYTEGKINDFTMTLNPTDNLPYFAYTRKVGDESNNNVSIAKWNGSAFSLVGPTGMADASARSASKPKVAFAKDGTLYAFYLGAEVANRPTVRKLDSEWAVVGATGFTPANNNTTYFYPFFVHPANAKLFYFWNGNTRNVDSYRTMNLSVFGGESWTSNVISAVPAYGSGSTSTSGMYYTSSFAMVGDKVYIASSLNEFGYFVHEVNADGSLSSIVYDFVPDGATHGLFNNLQLKAGVDGALFLLAAVRLEDSGTMQVFSVDQSANTLKAYGAGFPITIGSLGGIDDNYGFAVNPVNGLVVAVHDGEGKVPVFSYLDDGLQWSNFTVDSPEAATSAYFVDFDKDGNGYIAYQSASGIELYRVGLEADILPE